jgi:parallel beta-helix repeat protein
VERPVTRRGLLVSVAAVVLVGDRAEQALPRVQASGPRCSKQVALPAQTLPTGTNVRSDPFNAIGDGTTDDTAAFASARDAAGVNGMVTVPPGTYILSGLQLNVAGQTWVIPPGATLKSKLATAIYTLRVAASDVTLTGGGTLDGNRANQSTLYAPFQTNSARTTWDDLTIKDCYSYGLLCAGDPSGLRVTRCRITNTYYNAIEVNPNNRDITDITISRNYIDNYTAGHTSDAGGISLWFSSDAGQRYRRVIISNNILYGYPRTGEDILGIEMKWGDAFAVTGNVVRGFGYGISMASGYNGTIVGNDVSGFSIYGIELASGDSIAATGNTIQDTDPRSPDSHSQALISVNSSASHMTISGNHLTQVSTGTNAAIQLWAGSVGSIHHIAITGNTIRRTAGGSGGIVTKWCPDVTIANNIIDFGGANNNAIYLMTDNAASPVTLTGQVITGNQILNYGTGTSAILYGNSGTAAGVDYAIFANNVFQGGSNGITATGGATLGSHTASANNVGP